MRETRVAYEVVTPLSFEQAAARCREELAKRGFGVLTEIDIQAKLAEKLGVAREPYLILGACHPPSAHRSLEAVPEVGVLLPCNVTVSREGGQTVVRAMNPNAALQMFDNAELATTAAEVGRSLVEVVEAVERG
ncbi:MAG TPA: DUF302 domain-containing protein [Thermoanaerobaculia bacterium]|nr:DUF302 domain-containing protein [Thermoanaerobaculia bacterium]